MDNEKEKASLKKVEEAKLDDATLNEIMFNLLNVSVSLMQLMTSELKKAKEQNFNQKSE